MTLRLLLIAHYSLLITHCSLLLLPLTQCSKTTLISHNVQIQGSYILNVHVKFIRSLPVTAASCKYGLYVCMTLLTTHGTHTLVTNRVANNKAKTLRSCIPAGRTTCQMILPPVCAKAAGKQTLLGCPVLRGKDYGHRRR